MSVIVTIRLKGDPRRVEEFAAANAEKMRAIADKGEAHGVIAHRFYGTDGGVMVVDEWPDEQSFRSFFDETSAEIGDMFGGTGVEPDGPPQIWRTLDSHDKVGWGA